MGSGLGKVHCKHWCNHCNIIMMHYKGGFKESMITFSDTYEIIFPKVK